jgi:hypothetical protein
MEEVPMSNKEIKLALEALHGEWVDARDEFEQATKNYDVAVRNIQQQCPHDEVDHFYAYEMHEVSCKICGKEL